MSVIVRSPGGSIVLFCKGADDVIKEKLAPDPKFLCKSALLFGQNLVADCNVLLKWLASNGPSSLVQRSDQHLCLHPG